MYTYLVRVIDGKIIGDSPGGHLYTEVLDARPGVYVVLSNPSTPDGKGSKDSNGNRRFGDIGNNIVRNVLRAERDAWQINDSAYASTRITSRVKNNLKNNVSARKILIVVVGIVNQLASNNGLTKVKKSEVLAIINSLKDAD